MGKLSRNQIAHDLAPLLDLMEGSRHDDHLDNILTRDGKVKLEKTTGFIPPQQVAVLNAAVQITRALQLIEDLCSTLDFNALGFDLSQPTDGTVTVTPGVRLPYAAGGFIPGGRALTLLSYSGIAGLASGTVALAANTLYYQPVYAAHDFSMDALVFEVTTAVAGNAMGGLYDCQATMLPGSLLATSTMSTGAMTSTGLKTLAFGTPYAILGGRWYVLALGTTSAASIRGVVGGAPALRGVSTASAAAFVQSQVGGKESLSGGWSALPATAGASSGNSDTYLHLGGRAA